MSAQIDDKVDDVDVETAWKVLQSSPRSQLVDVRTRAEWTYVGIPDLGPVGKRTVLVEWQTFPDQAVDPRFVERLAGELKALPVESLKPVGAGDADAGQLLPRVPQPVRTPVEIDDPPFKAVEQGAGVEPRALVNHALGSIPEHGARTLSGFRPR